MAKKEVPQVREIEEIVLHPTVKDLSEDVLPLKDYVEG
ncbi:MAG: hypothetical protein UT34_C0001G0186 [candidate division WS6 bacterium GW2011_GWF2_39_15]|uniref:Uncharacterized protein n=1 Tax=candidate division WS6 bacterium GW2011_GWF2_39_15 TaxID=1619100 RepID=A0A0G0N019_9BACT|nr:MAG: hypothetical protein UT34_C0001G0186 [candidate division WS6 bacterium GW2011_GWF2_39_15]